MIHVCSIIFFFSSRRRHTRCLSDWSSDVCSSDLDLALVVEIGHFIEARILEAMEVDFVDESEVLTPADDELHIDKTDRSEERRVGKECRTSTRACQEKKKEQKQVQTYRKMKRKAT